MTSLNQDSQAMTQESGIDDDLVPGSPDQGETSINTPWTLLKGLCQKASTVEGNTKNPSGNKNGHEPILLAGSPTAAEGESGKEQSGPEEKHSATETQSAGGDSAGTAGYSGGFSGAGGSGGGGGGDGPPGEIPLDLMEEDESHEPTCVTSSSGEDAEALLPVVIPPPEKFSNSPDAQDVINILHGDGQFGDHSYSDAQRPDVSGQAVIVTVEDTPVDPDKRSNGHSTQKDIESIDENQPASEVLREAASVSSPTSLLSELNRSTMERLTKETEISASSDIPKERELLQEAQAANILEQMGDYAFSSSTSEKIQILQVSQDQSQMVDSDTAPLQLRLSLSTPAESEDTNKPQEVPIQEIVEEVELISPAKAAESEKDETDIDDSVEIVDVLCKRKSVEVVYCSNWPRKVSVDKKEKEEPEEDLQLRYAPSQNTQDTPTTEGVEDSGPLIFSTQKKVEISTLSVSSEEEEPPEIVAAAGEKELGENIEAFSQSFVRNSTPNPPPSADITIDNETEGNKLDMSIDGDQDAKNDAQHISPIQEALCRHSTPHDLSNNLPGSLNISEEHEPPGKCDDKKVQSDSDTSKQDTEVITTETAVAEKHSSRVIIEASIKIMEEDGTVLYSKLNTSRTVSKQVAFCAVMDFDRRLDSYSPGDYSGDVSSFSKSTSSSSKKGRLSYTSTTSSENATYGIPRPTKSYTNILKSAIARNSPIAQQRTKKPVTFAKHLSHGGKSGYNIASSSLESSTDSPVTEHNEDVEPIKRLSRVDEKGEAPADEDIPFTSKTRTEVVQVVEEMELETQWRPLAPGIHVFAKWQDRYFYPGCIEEKAEQDMWKVAFVDGTLGSIRDTNIVPIEVLARGNSVYASSANEDYCVGIVTSHQRKGKEILYEVSLEGGKTEIFPRSRLALNKDQAQNVRKAAFPASPSVSSRIVDLSLDNIVEGKRRRGKQTPQTPARGSSVKMDPNLDPSAASDQSDVEGMSSKKKGKALMNRLRETPKKQQSPYRGRGKRKKLDMSEEDEQDVGLTSDKKRKTDTSSSPTKTHSTEAQTDFPDHSLGPMPKSKIFQGKAFLLTRPESVAQHRAADTDSSSSQSQSQPEESPSVPFVRSHVCRQLQAGGGVVVGSFEELQTWEDGQRFLVTDCYSKSAKFMSCLAVGIPPVSYRWVLECCRLNRLTTWKTWCLPAGWSFEMEDEVDWFSPPSRGGLMDSLRFLVVSEKKQEFCQVWQQVLMAARARRVDVCLSHNIKKGLMRNVDMVLTDESCPRKLVNEAKQAGIPIVTSLWVIQSLIIGKMMVVGSDPRYGHSVSSSSDTS